MPITPAERTAIEALLQSVNEKINEIISAREDVYALLRIVGDINNNAIEDAILASAKTRARTAAEQLVVLLQ